MGSSGGGGIGGGLVGTVVGGLVGGKLGNGIKSSHGPGTPRVQPGYGQFQQGYNAIDALLLPYEELQQNGLIDPIYAKGYAGLKPGESRFGRAVSSYESQLASADPIFGQYRNTVQQGLQGIENGGIPDDLRRSITEGLRSSQASRDILDSNTAAIEEVVRLMGGQEAIRSQRLAEAQNYFGQVTSNVANLFAPGLNNYLQASLGSSGLNIDRAKISASNKQNMADNTQKFSSNIVSALI